MATRAYLGAPTVRTPTDEGTQVENIQTLEIQHVML